MKSAVLTLKIILLLGAIAMMGYGSIRIYQETRYREPVVISYDAFVRQKPTAGWFHIKNCVFNVAGARYYNSPFRTNLAPYGDNLTNAYIPVQSPKMPQKVGYRPDAAFVVLTNDPDILYTYSQFRQTRPVSEAEKRANKEAEITTISGHHFTGFDVQDRADFIQKNKRRLYPERDVEGMIGLGKFGLPAAHSKFLPGSPAPTEPAFVTLEEGKTPSTAFGLKMLGLGAVLLIIQIALYISWRER